MLENVKWPDTPFDVKDSLFMAMVVGSESHGLKIPPEDPDSIDDIDIMGIVVPPVDYYLGLKRWEVKHSFKGEWDVILYELKKFVGMLMNQNPNVVGTLWLKPEFYLYKTGVVDELIKNRMLFQCRRKAYNAFLGYVRQQLRRMTSGKFEGYMGDKRKRLVEKFGFDCKNSAHLIRLLHMGIEYLNTCELNVYRTWDKDMLLEIKKGYWPLTKIKEYADYKFSEMEEAYNNSKMQEEVPFEKVNRLLINLLMERLV